MRGFRIVIGIYMVCLLAGYLAFMTPQFQYTKQVDNHYTAEYHSNIQPVTVINTTVVEKVPVDVRFEAIGDCILVNGELMRCNKW